MRLVRLLYMVTVVLVAAAGSPSANAQGVTPVKQGACVGKATESISPDALRRVGEEMRSHHFEAAVKAAQVPGSGMRITTLRRDEHGNIADLIIVNAKNGCPVVMKHLHPGY
jgi:hypothetical protein